MKINTLLALVLLVALSTKPQHGAANAEPEQVLDASGKKVRAGINYYIEPAPRNEHVGGLALDSIGNKECPQDVVAAFQGQKVTFAPLHSKNKTIVRVSTDLNIVFNIYPTCPESTVWKLKDYDDSTGQWFVTSGGVIGNPGSQTINNWFKIEKYEDAYKLVYCPSVCTYCRPQCRDLGIYEDQYGKRLALSDVPYKVQFQLAAKN
ncbi:Proteinase inhibitor I3, Kunitz legume [Sesbania bispinosa]|nr:Proteinase inhibitor I3, Kunitz legume [Sesbania bispinosa]